MKKLFFAVAMAMCALCGCKFFENIGDVDTLMRLAGATTGQVIMMSKLDAKTHNAIYETVTVIRDVTPATNETWQAACNRVAEPVVDKLVEDGKLPAESKALVMAAANTIGLAIDFEFDKHPSWKDDADKVKVAISAFCDGVLTVVKPANDTSLSAPAERDEELYQYLKSKGC